MLGDQITQKSQSTQHAQESNPCILANKKLASTKTGAKDGTYALPKWSTKLNLKKTPIG